MSETFEGFIPPTKNFFHMPNEWINISARITNLAELKVVQYVLRHTWGYREYDGKPKPITVDEFMHGRKRADGTRIDDGTGLSKPSVIQGLKYAIEHGYLICEIDDVDKARIIKSYALKMSDASEVKDLNPQEENRGKETLPQGSSIFTTEVKDLDSKGKETLHRSEKDTLERNSRKTDNLSIDRATLVADSLAAISVSLENATRDQLYARLNELEQESPELEHLFTSPVDNSEPPVEKQASTVLPIVKEATQKVEPKATRKTGRTHNTEPLQKPLPKLEEPQLSEKARAIWTEWIGLPWHGGLTPKLTATAADHCETLAQANESITKDIMFKVRNFAKKNDKNGFYEGKKWTLGNMVTEYPNWKSSQYQIPSVPVEQKVTTGTRHMTRFSIS